MDLQVTKKACPYLKTVLHTTKVQEESCDVIVPDNEQDAQSVIYTSATAYIRSRECRDGCVIVNGSIHAGAIYRSEGEEQNRSCQADMPFSVRFEQADITENCKTIITCNVENAEARLANSRKIMFRVTYHICLTAMQDVTEDLYSLEDKPQALQVKLQEYCLNLPTESAEKMLSMAEEFSLPEGKRPTVICGYEILPIIEEEKLLGSRAVFKGMLFARILYLDEESNPAVMEQKIPFSQFADLAGEYEQEQVSFVMSCTGCECKITASEQIMLSVSLLAQCLIVRRQTVTVYEDAYAIGSKFEGSWIGLNFESKLDMQKLCESASVKFSEPVRTVVDHRVYIQSAQFKNENDAETVVVPVNVNILYYDNENALQQAIISENVQFDFALADSAQCIVYPSLLSGRSSVTVSSGTEVRFDLQMITDCYSNLVLQTLAGGTLSEQEQQQSPSVIVRSTEAGSSVWELAKQYGTLVDAIMEANNLSIPELAEQMLLLIPITSQVD